MKDNGEQRENSALDITRTSEFNDVSPRLDHLTDENRELLALFQKHYKDALYDPERFVPYLRLFRPCRVKVLLVADGRLDFSLTDFGLRAFVEAIHTMPGSFVQFEITLAHINAGINDDRMMGGLAPVPWISRRIKGFKFDDSSHFTPTMYDQVWLFGIETEYSRGKNPAGQDYPSDRLGDAELEALRNFMDGGGGLFATGDHGYLGVCLSGSVPRARSMRLWGDTSPNQDINEVSMKYRRRNDTNRIGPSPESQFNDQSDDVPQDIHPKMYHAWPGIWKLSFPHPLLCGPKGVIRVLPDHPHEGQCVEPNNPDIDEYPDGINGFPRPLPEVIATSTVLAGSNAGRSKADTEPHSFGAICAYDGHQAGLGRVVTDATWHHSVNVNLTGERDFPPPVGDPKRMGFNYSPSGQAHFENIKTYYRNIALWLSRPALLRCMRWRILFGLTYNHRVLEAVMTRPKLPLNRADVSIIYDIGRHARDVLGSYAGHCQARRIALDLIGELVDTEIVWRLDPWIEQPSGNNPSIPEPDPVPWFDLDPILDAAVGGALLSIREEFREPDENIDTPEIKEEVFEKAVSRGVKTAVELSFKSIENSNKIFRSLLTRRDEGSSA